MSGAAASAMTLTFGKTYIYIMEKIYTGEMSEDEIDVAKVKGVMNGNIEVSETGAIVEYLQPVPIVDKKISRDEGLFSKISQLFSKFRK